MSTEICRHSHEKRICPTCSQENTNINQSLNSKTQHDMSDFVRKAMKVKLKTLLPSRPAG